MIKKQIPNLFTLLNLLSGLIAVILALTDKLVEAAFFVMLGIFFDFFDGFFARMFKVSGEMGKQLDSLADMVTSGVAPGLVMFQMLMMSTKHQWFMNYNCEVDSWQSFGQVEWNYLPFLGLLIPLASAYRLAKFNIDERQTSSFIGLPTPAMSLFVVSLPLILISSDIEFVSDLIQNKYVLIGITLVGSYLLNAEIPLFSLKFKDYSWKNNVAKYVFLILSVVLIVVLKTVSIPVIIILYVLISIIDNGVKNNSTSD
jgi:CDP-diacylglycerol--serine O-phosphatidyltransferase